MIDSMTPPARKTAMILRRGSLSLFILALALSGAALPADEPTLQYPAAAAGDVVDDYHGTKVADPYRWLEDVDSPETKAWVVAENQVTQKYLSGLPDRDAFKKRITDLWNYPKVTLPFREAGRIFYRKNSGLQQQSTLYMRASLSTEARLLLDPNVQWPDGSVAVRSLSPSPDGKLLAYSTSEGGTDWETLHLREIASGKDRPDTLEWVRFSGVSWTKDGKGFFYSRYPEPPKGEALHAAARDQKIYYHRAGDPQEKDRLVYERKDLPSWFLGAQVTEDGRYLVIGMSRGADRRNRLYFAALGDPQKPNPGAPVKPLLEEDDAEQAFLGNNGTTFYLSTDSNAPKRRIVSFDLRHPERKAWKTVIPEGSDTIATAVLAGEHVALHYLVDVQSHIRVFTLSGKPEGEIPLPGVGSVQDLGGRNDTPELYYLYTSQLSPSTVYRYDFKTGRTASFEPEKPRFDPSGYETKQVFCKSKDGTRVPLFITARKGLVRDGSNPTVLEAYGGFDISLTPSYDPDVPAWLERGGVYVTANLRGGSEYGEVWHKAGMLEKKQNVFDDFIAAAEYLVQEKITSPAKLAIRGGSNGGLLVGAVMEQRPELFGVALPAVGVMDMLRFDKFTAGVAWVSEYGSSGDPKMFPVLRAYSPLHNLKSGTCYPATLVTTADHDDRVVPGHSFKFAAALQAAQGCSKPTLIRIETQASHGYAATDKRIQILADLWSFTAANLGLPPAPAAAKQ
jgi:prolyl oligopeptidase